MDSFHSCKDVLRLFEVNFDVLTFEVLLLGLLPLLCKMKWAINYTFTKFFFILSYTLTSLCTDIPAEIFKKFLRVTGRRSALLVYISVDFIERAPRIYSFLLKSDLLD